MNFVHFPKLDEYAIDPDIDDGLLDFDTNSRLLKTKLNLFSSSRLYPNVIQNKSKKESKHDGYKDHNLKRSGVGLHDGGNRRLVYHGNRHRQDSKEECLVDAGRGVISPHSYFFRRWDDIPLVSPEQDSPFSEASNTFQKDEFHEGWMHDPGTSQHLKKDNNSGHLSIAHIKNVGAGQHVVGEVVTLKRQQNSPKLWRLCQSISQMDSASQLNPAQKENEKAKWHDMKVTEFQSVVDRFRKIIQAVKIVLKLAKSIMKTSDSPSALLKTFTSFSTVPDEEDEEESSSENMKKYGLHFDPSYFKANREISLSIEVRNILKLHPNRRTPEQIQTTVFGLQSIPSFAEYPLHMQEKLAKVAWLDIVTPSRTIIRQGHFAENFYFIVSGQALVTIHRPGETSAQTAALMRKGTSFGELALLHHSRRTATVTSHDTVQLLSVGRDDFFDIFMSRDIKGQVPEHITFLRQLEFMKDWPIERLLERPDQCLLHFFKRNMVIVKDSQLSEWLYVVKSGSCQVLKQLKGVTARLGPLRGQANSSPDRKSHSKIFLYGRCKTGEKRTSRIESEFRHTNVVNTDVDKVKGTFPLIEEKAAKHNATESSATPSNKTNEDPVFVRIELLKPMDIFGLDRVNFNNSVDLESTSVSLVSLGAECIMLSKSFYMKHANDKVKKRLSETITPYPNEATLQDSLQHKVNWELYKQSILLAASPKHLKRKHLTGNASRKLIIGSNH